MFYFFFIYSFLVLCFCMFLLLCFRFSYSYISFLSFRPILSYSGFVKHLILFSHLGYMRPPCVTYHHIRSGSLNVRQTIDEINQSTDRGSPSRRSPAAPFGIGQGSARISSRHSLGPFCPTEVPASSTRSASSSLPSTTQQCANRNLLFLSEQMTSTGERMGRGGAGGGTFVNHRDDTVWKMPYFFCTINVQRPNE